MPNIDVVRYAVSVLNRWGWTRFPSKQEALVIARVARGKYVCAHCEETFGPRQIEVDHKAPRIDPKRGFVSIDEYVKRTFVPSSKLQVLCKPCHYKKSAEENKERQ